MKALRLPALLLTCVSLSLAGCATTAEVRPVRDAREALFPFPQQPAESIRLVIYRPQVLVGMWGKPVILVNGQRMGNPGSPMSDNHLQPGTVFVVDAPAALTRVGWSQPGRDEATDQAIAYSGLAGATRYLRWTLKPTYGYLQEVDEARALEEIASLRFSAYVNQLARK
jgi:hypothetical protein